MAQGAAAARRLTMIVVTALGVAGLAGCGKDEAPPAPPTSVSSSPTPTSPSPTPTPTPTPTPPPKPAEWTQNDDAGALAAAQYFMDLYNYVIATGDLSDWNALSTPGCVFCTNVGAALDEVASRGNRYEGGAITIRDGKVAGFDQSVGVYGVQFAYTTVERRELDGAGRVVRTIAPEDQWVIVDVAPADDGWRLVEGDARSEPSA